MSISFQTCQARADTGRGGWESSVAEPLEYHVLRARGPTDAEVFSYHPVVREHYPQRIDAIEADLEALVEGGDAVALTPPFLELDHVEVYDIVDTERSGWRTRYQRDWRSIIDGRSVRAGADGRVDDAGRK